MEPQERRKLYERFLRAPKCDLDDWWGVPFQEQTGTVEALEAEDLQFALSTLARRLKSTNMGLEGVFSEMRAASKTVKGSTYAEKLVFATHLDQINKEHLRNGGKDIRKVTSSDMVES